MLELILYFQSVISIALSVYAIIEVKAIKKSTHKVIMPTSMVSQNSPRSEIFDSKLNEATESNMFLTEDDLIL